MYLVWGGVGVPVPRGCTWSGGCWCTCSGECTWSWGEGGGVPGPRGCVPGLGGVPGPGGVPGLGGCTWSGMHLVLGRCTWSRGVPGQTLPP